MLIIMSGLSGTGKTTISRELAKRSGAVHIRIDSIEQALRNAGINVEAEGYQAAYAVAEDNLRLGHTVVVDCVNPWRLTRQEWHGVARRSGADAIDVEIVCSDIALHRERAESRASDLAGHSVPSWEEVIGRDYQQWEEDVVRIDTATTSIAEAVARIRAAL